MPHFDQSGSWNQAQLILDQIDHLNKRSEKRSISQGPYRFPDWILFFEINLFLRWANVASHVAPDH